MPTLGTMIRERRQGLNLTLAALAARVGASRVQVSCWETDEYTPSASQLARLVSALGPLVPASGATVASRRLKYPQLQVGAFVTTDERSGTGKVCAVDDETVTVGFFRSLNQRSQTRQVPRVMVRPVRLAPQTRCFFQGPDDRWFVGRIGREVDGEYEVLLPDERAVFMPPARLYVRSSAPVEDPLEVLIHGAQESPFLHDRRHALVASLVQQRAIAHGMTGLVSARIDLYPHQIEVVRRVLEDPIQRYLLADEVGLGKTIEAGVILRQYLLDHAAGARAVVAVPPMLVEQWRRELDLKFAAFTRPDAVRVVAIDDVGRLDAVPECGLLIIDEAHHVAALAFAEDAASRGRFDTFCRLARVAERVLLLSATPVLRHERDFLAMLHLLDPERYRLSDVEAFRQRVEKRQAVGRILRALREDVANPTLIKLNLGSLRREFPDDARLAALADDVARAVAESGDEVRRTAIRALRVHVSETYRLHRRMARTRRRSVEDGRDPVVPPRFDGGAKRAPPLIEEHDLDERAEPVHDLLDTWRSSAAGSLPMAVTGAADAADGPRAALRGIFLTLFETAGCSLELLAHTVSSRRCRSPDPMLRDELGEERARALCETPHFDGELKILDDLLEVLAQPAGSTRAAQMVQVARSIVHAATGARPPKVAFFTSSTLVCRELTQLFVAAFGPAAVASHERDRPPAEVERDVARFRDAASDCRYLIADQSGEEGRNLQAADVMVHFDLPWSPNRLEQRIGRLDRIGRARAIRARVCLGPDCEGSMFDAWNRVLRDGLGVFHSSIAALQFFVDERLPELADRFFAGGAAALEAAVEPLREAVAEEQGRLGDQDAVDEIDALVREGRGHSEALAEFDARYGDIESAMHGWVAEALGFSYTRDEVAGTVRYAPSTRALVPADVLLDRFKPFLGGYLAAFDREACGLQPTAALLRIGDAFVDAFAAYLRWDDRGQAFALWRQVPSWPAQPGAEWVGFRFTYVIEADVDAAGRVLAERSAMADLSALRRRADAWFPPRVRTTFIDGDGKAVRDLALLAILEAPYVPVKERGGDTNLAKEKVGVIASCVDPERWPVLCRQARHASREVLVDSQEFRDSCEQSAAKAEGELSIRVEQLRLRSADERRGEAAAAESDDDWATERRLGDALIAGIRRPHVRLDSVGFIIVSGRSPPAARSTQGAP
jgi:ATP-dependent helicase HepA